MEFCKKAEKQTYFQEQDIWQEKAPLMTETWMSKPSQQNKINNFCLNKCLNKKIFIFLPKYIYRFISKCNRSWAKYIFYQGNTHFHPNKPVYKIEISAAAVVVELPLVLVLVLGGRP